MSTEKKRVSNVTVKICRGVAKGWILVRNDGEHDVVLRLPNGCTALMEGGKPRWRLVPATTKAELRKPGIVLRGS